LLLWQQYKSTIPLATIAVAIACPYGGNKGHYITVDIFTLLY